MAWCHSETAGFGREWDAHREVQWLVRNVVLEIIGPDSCGDTLTLTTEVTG